MDPIEARDLPAPRSLSPAFFRATNPHLGHADFEAKWATARKSPLRFFRSFPQAYWLLLERVPAAHVPGRIGICYGDAHLENFGLLRSVRGPLVFVANDLDDAGPGEVGLDALRWAVSLALAGEKRRQVQALIAEYAAVARGARAAALPSSLVPEAGDVAARRLGKLVRRERLVLGEQTELARVDRQERALVSAAFRTDRSLREHTLLDVAELARVGGGSGGLRRFWALTRRGTGRRAELDVLELKELTTPAVQWGHHRTPLGDRIAEVKAVLHAGTPVRDHASVMLGHAEFLVRSRLGRAAIDLTELTAEDRMTTLKAQAGLLGRDHRRAYRGIEAKALKGWLAESTETMSRYFEELHRQM